ncbi:ethanolamine utilization protein [Escherichia coli]|nr:ethanolamine utilization protein [Escherichia coli]
MADLLGFTITECDESIPVTASVPASVPADKTESQRIHETIIAQLPEGQFTESLVAQLMEKVMKEKTVAGAGCNAAELQIGDRQRRHQSD